MSILEADHLRLEILALLPLSSVPLCKQLHLSVPVLSAAAHNHTVPRPSGLGLVLPSRKKQLRLECWCLVRGIYLDANYWLSRSDYGEGWKEVGVAKVPGLQGQENHRKDRDRRRRGEEEATMGYHEKQKQNRTWARRKDSESGKERCDPDEG